MNRREVIVAGAATSLAHLVSVVSGCAAQTANAPSTLPTPPAGDARAALQRAAAECVRELRTTGYSHVVVDHSMLRRWRASGWLDAGLTDERVRAFLDLLDPVAETAGECSIHRIPRADTP